MNWNEHSFGDPTDHAARGSALNTDLGPIDLLIRETVKRTDETASARVRALREMAPTLARVADDIELDEYMSRVARSLYFTHKQVVQEVRNAAMAIARSRVAFTMRDADESPIERLFREAAVSARWDLELAAQYPIGIYRVDFAHIETRTAIELDGFDHHSSTEDIEKDRRRQREINAAGWHVIRFGGREVHRDAAACVREAMRCVEARAMKGAAEWSGSK